nr:hypothetical protein [Tanacetum cinerariifolium]
MEEHRYESIDTVFNCVISYIHNGADRNAVSLWLTLKGLPLYFMKNYSCIGITTWFKEIAVSFKYLKVLHVRCLSVLDSDLKLLMRTRGKDLRVLKIIKCQGFSTDGLMHIGKYCNTLNEKDGKWLHELAVNNKCIETLNFYDTAISKVDANDLTLLAKNCRSLYMEFVHMTQNQCQFLIPHAHRLTELNLTYDNVDESCLFYLIKKCPNLEALYTIDIFGDRALQVIAKSCKKLRKFETFGLVTPGEWSSSEKASRFSNDFVQRRQFNKLAVRGGSDAGLVKLSKGCPKLRKLEIQNCPFSMQALSTLMINIRSLRDVMVMNLEDTEIIISWDGDWNIELDEDLAVTNLQLRVISNEAMECIGSHLKNLRIFRMTFGYADRKTALPQDDGIRAMLVGCSKLEWLGIYNRGLTDAGLDYIGKYGRNLIYLSLG